MTVPWRAWADQVLAGIGAPDSAINLASLQAWSQQESGSDLMRWNNPLNTTQLMAGSLPMNSVGVQRYPSPETGATATIWTLLNGRYPGIVDHLRRSVPLDEWGDVCGELQTWGTGCGWIGGTNDMTPEELQSALRSVLNEGVGNGQDNWADTVKATLGKVEALTNAVAGEGADLAAAKQDLAQLLEHPAAADPAVLELLQRLSTHLGLGTA